MGLRSVADVPSSSLFSDPRFVERCDAHALSFDNAGACQLHQWQLWLEERGTTWSRLAPSLAAQCRMSFCAEEGVPSRLHGRVAATLAVLGLEPRDEVRTPQGYSLDMVVNYEGREVAIEVDGPFHFVGHTRQPSGATLLKRRHVRGLGGMRLLVVPYWEWNALGSGPTGRHQKMEYLQEGLARAY